MSVLSRIGLASVLIGLALTAGCSAGPVPAASPPASTRATTCPDGYGYTEEDLATGEARMIEQGLNIVRGSFHGVACDRSAESATVLLDVGCAQPIRQIVIFAWSDKVILTSASRFKFAMYEFTTQPTPEEIKKYLLCETG